MSDSNVLDELQTVDGLKEIPFDPCRCLIHNDHRWLLPIIHHGQTEAWIPKPCTLVMFDRHHDAFEPTSECMDRIRELIRDGTTSLDTLVELCQSWLAKIDNDWIKAGIYLGLIGNVVIFQKIRCKDAGEIQPREELGKKFRIEILGMPGRELTYQGQLVDSRKVPGNAWEILGWEVSSTSCAFRQDLAPILLDFDLDSFAIEWTDYLIPWPEKIFEAEFNQVSDYGQAGGWTGQAFVEGLIRKAGLITIAREPDHCGGPEEADEILRKINSYLFSTKLRIDECS